MTAGPPAGSLPKRTEVLVAGGGAGRSRGGRQARVDPWAARNTVRYVLVRPDQHVALYGSQLLNDPRDLLDRVRGRAPAPAHPAGRP